MRWSRPPPTAVNWVSSPVSADEEPVSGRDHEAPGSRTSRQPGWGTALFAARSEGVELGLLIAVQLLASGLEHRQRRGGGVPSRENGGR